MAGPNLSPANSAPQAAPADVHRRLIELYLAGRLDEAIKLIGPNAVDHRGGQIGDVHGREAWRRKWEQMGSIAEPATPKVVDIKIAQNVTQGEISVNRYRVRVVDPRSGRTLEMDGMDMVHIRDGHVTEHWGFLDTAALATPA